MISSKLFFSLADTRRIGSDRPCLRGKCFPLHPVPFDAFTTAEESPRYFPTVLTLPLRSARSVRRPAPAESTRTGTQHQSKHHSPEATPRYMAGGGGHSHRLQSVLRCGKTCRISRDYSGILSTSSYLATRSSAVSRTKSSSSSFTSVPPCSL